MRLVKNGNGVETEIAQKTGDIDVAATIKELLLENTIKPEELEKTVTYEGSGSFTGIKIGSTIANILNWALGITEAKDQSPPDYGKEPNVQM